MWFKKLNIKNIVIHGVLIFGFLLSQLLEIISVLYTTIFIMVDDKIYNFLLLYACLLELNSKFKMLLKHNVVYRLRINLRFKSSWIKKPFLSGI